MLKVCTYSIFVLYNNHGLYNSFCTLHICLTYCNRVILNFMTPPSCVSQHTTDTCICKTNHSFHKRRMECCKTWNPHIYVTVTSEKITWYFVKIVRCIYRFIMYVNKTGTRQCTRAIWSTFSEVHSTHPGGVKIAQ